MTSSDDPNRSVAVFISRSLSQSVEGRVAQHLHVHIERMRSFPTTMHIIKCGEKCHRNGAAGQNWRSRTCKTACSRAKHTLKYRVIFRDLLSIARVCNSLPSLCSRRRCAEYARWSRAFHTHTQCVCIYVCVCTRKYTHWERESRNATQTHHCCSII